jgi:hypothetical protein
MNSARADSDKRFPLRCRPRIIFPSIFEKKYIRAAHQGPNPNGVPQHSPRSAKCHPGDARRTRVRTRTYPNGVPQHSPGSAKRHPGCAERTKVRTPTGFHNKAQGQRSATLGTRGAPGSEPARTPTGFHNIAQGQRSATLGLARSPGSEPPHVPQRGSTTLGTPATLPFFLTTDEAVVGGSNKWQIGDLRATLFEGERGEVAVEVGNVVG